MAQTLREIKTMLASRGLRPKRWLGQNFLHDANHMVRIIAGADPGPADSVLEIGAGTGALTERLIDTGASVTAVEIDRDLEPILRERVGEQANIHIGDVLRRKNQLNPEVLGLLEGDFKLVANLPYQIASPLLVNLGLDHPSMTAAVVMIQYEVAERILAQPFNKTYGPIGVILQALFSVERIGSLRPSCFWPQPKVSSTMIGLKRRPKPICSDTHHFAQFVHRLFNKRRKQLRSILGRDFPYPFEITPTARPETLRVDEIAYLASLAAREYEYRAKNPGVFTPGYWEM